MSVTLTQEERDNMRAEFSEAIGEAIGTIVDAGLANGSALTNEEISASYAAINVLERLAQRFDTKESDT